MASLISALAIQKFELTLPTSKRKIDYRAFLVKEEKILMTASESKSEKDMYRAMRDVVSACTFNTLDIDALPVVDMEYVFLKIRSRSVGETASPTLKCSNCDKPTEAKIDLSKIEPTYNEAHRTKIVLGENIILEMKYPRFSDLTEIDSSKSDLDKSLAMLIACMDKVHTKDGVVVLRDVERSEVEEFVGNFNQEQLQKVMKFIETMPKLTSEITFQCPHCKHENNYQLEGIRDFFLIATSHDSLMNQFETNFAMMQHHKYSLTEIENMVPWERQIYIALLIQHLKEEKEKMERGEGGGFNMDDMNNL